MARTLAGAIWSSTKLVPRSNAAAVVAGAVSAAVAAEAVVDMAAVVAAGAAAATVEIAATGAIAAIAGSDFLLPDSCKKRLFIVDAASPFTTLDARALFKSAPSIGPRSRSSLRCLRDVTVS
ncbi:MAG TPA: hypothetical protein VFR42_04785 [Candidatus Acidoferrum sp.]|nr:hypothetical protein [Candidatus Acidoferrum sp.]